MAARAPTLRGDKRPGVTPAAPLPFDPVAEARRNWQRHEWPHPEAMAAITSITRAHQVLLARIDAVLRPLELTFARYEALVLL